MNNINDLNNNLQIKYDNLNKNIIINENILNNELNNKNN